MKFALLALALVACRSVPAPVSSTGANASEAEAAVVELYDQITFAAGTTPDWEKVRSLFLDEAVIVLRTGRDETTVLSLDGFIGDFQAFIENADVEASGFTERILGMRAFAYGDIAHVLVLFESHIPGSGRPPGEGIDSIELVRRDGRWRVAAITNERPTPDRPIPRELFEE